MQRNFSAFSCPCIIASWDLILQFSGHCMLARCGNLDTYPKKTPLRASFLETVKIGRWDFQHIYWFLQLSHWNYHLLNSLNQEDHHKYFSINFLVRNYRITIRTEFTFQATNLPINETTPVRFNNSSRLLLNALYEVQTDINLDTEGVQWNNNRVYSFVRTPGRSQAYMKNHRLFNWVA